jgi:uncharacterized protein (TIGR00369 family)
LVSTETASSSYPQCFVCGSDNPAGLHVPFGPAPDGGSRADYTMKPEHVGWPGIVHGGLVFTLMDEAVAWALACAGLHGVTAKAEARFRAPVTVGVPLVITGRIVEQSRRLVRAHAEIRRADGQRELHAELDAVMYLADVG